MTYLNPDKGLEVRYKYEFVLPRGGCEKKTVIHEMGQSISSQVTDSVSFIFIKTTIATKSSHSSELAVFAIDLGLFKKTR